MQYCQEQLEAVAHSLSRSWKHYQRVLLYAFYDGAQLRAGIDSYENAISKIADEAFRPALTPVVPGIAPVVLSATLTWDRCKRKRHTTEMTTDWMVFEEENTP